MKNPFEVLKTKEQEVAKVKKEINALRVTIQLIGDEKSALTKSGPALCHRNAVGRNSSFNLRRNHHGARAFPPVLL